MRKLAARLVLVTALMATACQPWYRDRENHARAVRRERGTGRELARAQAEHAKGHDGRAADILRELVARDPGAAPGVWLLLGELEQRAGHPAKARAYARWGLRHHGDAAELRQFLVQSLADDGLIAQALNVIQPQTLDAAMRTPPLSRALGELQRAVAQAGTNPEAALARLTTWLDSYGEPDHQVLEDARETVARAAWQAAQADGAPRSLARLKLLGDWVRQEVERGELSSALSLYAQAHRLLPREVSAPLGAPLAGAVGAADPAMLDPNAYALALEGDAALREGRLGAAIGLYRRAVASAPWWHQARLNLAAMLALETAG